MSNTPKEDAYNAEISPLLEKIMDLCEKHKINFISSFQLDSDEEKYAVSSSQWFDQDQPQERYAPVLRLFAKADHYDGLANALLDLSIEMLDSVSEVDGQERGTIH